MKYLLPGMNIYNWNAKPNKAIRMISDFWSFVANRCIQLSESKNRRNRKISWRICTKKTKKLRKIWVFVEKFWYKISERVSLINLRIKLRWTKIKIKKIIRVILKKQKKKFKIEFHEKKIWRNFYKTVYYYQKKNIIKFFGLFFKQKNHKNIEKFF